MLEELAIPFIVMGVGLVIIFIGLLVSAYIFNRNHQAEIASIDAAIKEIQENADKIRGRL